MIAPLLKLVLLYNAGPNEYNILAHNLTPDAAEEFVAKNVSAGSLLVVEQGSKHKTQVAEECRTCRRDVARAAGLQPKPKFRRRKT